MYPRQSLPIPRESLTFSLQPQLDELLQVSSLLLQCLHRYAAIWQ